MTHPENEPEGGWNPENERVPEELQREYLKFIKNMNEQAEDQKRRKAKEEKMQAELQKIAGERPAAPGGLASLVGFLTQPTRQPTYDEMTAMCNRAWNDTKKATPKAPDGVRSVVFHTLLQYLVQRHQDDIA